MILEIDSGSGFEPVACLLSFSEDESTEVLGTTTEGLTPDGAPQSGIIRLKPFQAMDCLLRRPDSYPTTSSGSCCGRELALNGG